MTADIDFGVMIGASDAPGTPDQSLYRTILEDSEEVLSLGFSTGWFFEHHFSDYYPTPSPLLLAAHVAGRFPELALGTSVIVLPWHQPLRLAGEIAMLSMLSSKPLHLGLGRGTATFEFERFGVNMDDSRALFEDAVEIIKKSLAGGPFTHVGKATDVPRLTEVRPRAASERIFLYGSIGSTDSAEVIGRLGLLPLAATLGESSHEKLAQLLATWERASTLGGPGPVGRKPLSMKVVIADTDEEAVAQAQRYIPAFFQAQLDHYMPTETNWREMNNYRGFERTAEVWERFTQPANIPEWCKWQLIGSPDTVARKLEGWIALGFDCFLLQSSTPRVPKEPRREWVRRFATEVAPRFSSRFHALSQV